MAYIRKGFLMFFAGFIFAAPRAASACHTVTLCLNWYANVSDDGFGEFNIVGEKVRASGARVTVIRPPSEPPLNRFLDQEGCMTFETQFAYGNKLVVYPEAWVGTPPVQILGVRDETENGLLVPAKAWPVHLHGLAANDVLEITVGDEGTDPISPLMAVATKVMHRFDELDVIPEPTPTLQVVFQEWKAGAFSGCGYITLGPDSYREKTVIAHEMGHWLQCNWGGGLYKHETIDYNFPSSDVPCRFGVLPATDLGGKPIDTNANDHGIRSSEWSTMAMKEGFAHFIAAATFNPVPEIDVSFSDGYGVFRYYKDINVENFPSYEDFVGASSLVSLLGGTAMDSPLGGENRWTANQCPNDWDEHEVSSEIDWMRFFWRFMTKVGTSNRPTLRQILAFFAYVDDDKVLYPINRTNVWPVLEEAMGVSSEWSEFLTRFQEANEVMGVYNDDTGT